MDRCLMYYRARDGRHLQSGRPMIQEGIACVGCASFESPTACTMVSICLEAYPGRPLEMFQLGLAVDTVTEVARRIYSIAGPRSTDSVCLQHWLLCFGGESGDLWKIIAVFV